MYFSKSLLVTAFVSLNLLNDGIVNGQKLPNDNYDVLVESVSDVFRMANQPNKTSYYCTFRSLWSRQRHPVQYPDLARYSAPVIFSHSLQYVPWVVGQRLTAGIEKIAESGFSDLFQQELEQAGEQNLDFQSWSGNAMWQTGPNKQTHVHIPPVEVNNEFPYLTTVAGIHPSPDWFTGFNRYFVADEYQRKYFDRFIIQTYPFDAGTDAALNYNDVDEDEDPAQNVHRITMDMTVNGQFVSPDGKHVLPVAEWDCVLHIGESILERPACDFLKFPNCNNTECVERGVGCYDTCDPGLPYDCGCDPDLTTEECGKNPDGASAGNISTLGVVSVVFAFLSLFV